MAEEKEQAGYAEDLEKLMATMKKRREDVPGLIALLKSKNLLYRRKAADYLGEIGDDRAVPALIEALKDESDVSWLAARSLGMIGDRRAIDPLIEALGSPEKWLRQGAAWALGKIGDEKAIEPSHPASCRTRRRMCARTPPGRSVLSGTSGQSSLSPGFSRTRTKV